MNESTFDELYRNWYANLSQAEKAEVDACADMWDEYDYIMECEL